MWQSVDPELDDVLLVLDEDVLLLVVLDEDVLVLPEDVLLLVLPEDVLLLVLPEDVLLVVLEPPVACPETSSMPMICAQLARSASKRARSALFTRPRWAVRIRTILLPKAPRARTLRRGPATTFHAKLPASCVEVR